MCGRFVVAKPGAELVGVLRADIVNEALPAPSYNIAPTSLAAIVLDSVKTEPPTRRVEPARWGLVPAWAKDPSIGSRAFNARVEEIETKPMFRGALEKRRAIVPASGYYEWKTTAAGKTPHYIHPSDEGSMFFAGLYEWWKNPAATDGTNPWMLSFTILTRSAIGTLGSIHDRMPLFVDADVAEAWLDPTIDNVGDILDAAVDAAPDLAETLDNHIVASAVGNVRNNSPELIEPVTFE
ncbi:putative SOS response-associated peptidase YedK [Microbacterium halimionae]|uniref:Abasic site processing protein n=1 Tax=Microbacterium halimionae TaxID=1526413 RepID=A0A7W3JN85_9MICO|nr:SOS response-associated peptidase [Microbacterium halimionae]MBA8815994.1 putative SOS response-associated peptidase YedK [Microbacterium halimionae]NII96197.1 putative SOS response-associated peptidase YedK [Microbacterium halimionae]